MGNEMTPEKALRWLIEFGSDWVPATTLARTWAVSEITWQTAVVYGYLEKGTLMDRYRLTSKSLKLIEELKT